MCSATAISIFSEGVPGATQSFGIGRRHCVQLHRHSAVSQAVANSEPPRSPNAFRQRIRSPSSTTSFLVARASSSSTLRTVPAVQPRTPIILANGGSKTKTRTTSFAATPSIEPTVQKQLGSVKDQMGKSIAGAVKSTAMQMMDTNLFEANWAASWDSTFGGTEISTADGTSTQHMHHNRDDGFEKWAENNPDATMFPNSAGSEGTDVPTPIRISITTEAPYQPQDLPLVAIKMFQPKSGKPTGVLKLTSPDVHTFLVPETTFL